MQQIPGDIIILLMCTKNHNHDVLFLRVRQNFLSFWTIFCPFTTLTTWKIKILENWKKDLEMLSFYACVP